MKQIIAIWKKLKFILLGLVSLVIILLLSGWGYQKAMEYNDSQDHPAEGKMILVNDNLMHIHCLGKGEPTVVLEQGLGNAAINWRHIHEELATITRTCAYDRAGLGHSQPLNAEISSREVAQNLNLLLKNAQIDGGIVLAGWSMGGVHVRSYFQQFPDEVKGMVLIDSSHEQQELRLPATTFSQWEQLVYQSRWTFGINRIIDESKQNFQVIFKRLNMPVLLREKIESQYNNSSHHASILLEFNAAIKDLKQTTPPLTLANLPLIVISAGLSLDESQEAKAMDKKWDEMQQELANLSTNGKRVVAAESDHSIPYMQPEIIINSVKELVALARKNG